jgi:hypothetical protein
VLTVLASTSSFAFITSNINTVFAKRHGGGGGSSGSSGGGGGGDNNTGQIGTKNDNGNNPVPTAPDLCTLDEHFDK